MLTVTPRVAPSIPPNCRRSAYDEAASVCRRYSVWRGIESRSIWKKTKNIGSSGHLRNFFFFSFVRWKLQSPRWRWQCIAGPSGFRTACGLRECGLARFPFWVARRWGRTAVDVLLSDCQYRKGTALYGQCGVWNTGDSWGGCGLSWAWIL